MPLTYFFALCVLLAMAYISRRQSAFVRCAAVQWVNWLAGVAFIAATSVTDPWAFNIAIDAIAAAIILAHPAARWQSALGSLYLVQIAMHVGYGLNRIGGNSDPLVYYDMLSWVGWLQIAVLGGWGGADLVKRLVPRFRHRRDPVAASQGNESVGAA